MLLLFYLLFCRPPAPLIILPPSSSYPPPLTAEDGEDLTHFGMSLGKVSSASSRGRGLSDGEDDDDDDDDEDGRVDARTVNQLHFGGGFFHKEGKQDGEKTKREIMHEVIMKSKFYKMERQEQRQEQRTFVEGLDGDFQDVRSLLDFGRASEVGSSSGLGSQGQETGSELKDSGDGSAHVNYNRQLNLLSMEARAQPGERVKSVEEMAQARRDKLEKLEEKRIERMMHDADAASLPKPAQPHERPRPQTATDDDLVINYLLDKDLVAQSSSEEEDDEEEEEEKDEDSEEEKIKTKEFMKAAKLAAEKAVAGEGDLPFVFAAPKNYKQLKELLSPWPRRQHALIYERIITCNNVNLGPENHAKMQNFYSMLWTHVRTVSDEMGAAALTASNQRGGQGTPSPSSPSSSSSASLAPSLRTLLVDLNGINAALFTLAHSMPKHSRARAHAFLRQVASSHLGLDLHSLALAPSPSAPPPRPSSSPSLPPVSVLLKFKILANLFPTSDYRHNVSTPTQVILSALLSRAPFRTPRDVATGLFISQLLLFHVGQSRSCRCFLLTHIVCCFSLVFSCTFSSSLLRAKCFSKRVVND